MDAQELIDSLAQDKGLSPAARIFANARADAEVEAGRLQQEAESARARDVDRAESVMIADRLLGQPAQEMRSARSRLADCEDEVAELEDRLARARSKRDQCRSSFEWWSEKGLLADQMSRRSAITEPSQLEQTTARAADALRQAREGRMVVERARRGVRR